MTQMQWTKKILIVDDEPVSLAFTSRHLVNTGFVCVQVKDGDEAIEILKSDPNGFAVVITDQIMPHMSGLDLLRAMQQLPPMINKIPVVMLTAIGDDAGKSYLADQGIFQYVVKPANPEVLIEAVKKAYQKNDQ